MKTTTGDDNLVRPMNTAFLVGALNGVYRADWTDALVYADWLEERGDSLAFYLRAGPAGERGAVEEQYKQLLAAIETDPTGPTLLRNSCQPWFLRFRYRRGVREMELDYHADALCLIRRNLSCGARVIRDWSQVHPKILRTCLISQVDCRVVEGFDPSLPYRLFNRALPAQPVEEMEVGEGPCIFCGEMVRHINDGGIAWIVQAIQKGKSTAFLYCNAPSCGGKDHGRHIWRCGCVSDFVETVGASCVACGRPRAKALPWGRERCIRCHRKFRVHDRNPEEYGGEYCSRCSKAAGIARVTRQGMGNTPGS